MCLLSFSISQNTVKMRVYRTSKRSQAKNYYGYFKTSLGIQTKLFFEKSTLHGVRYIAEKNRPFYEKFLWFSCVFVGAVTTAVIIVSLWEKFQTNPTITGLDTDFHNWDVPFPAITLCQEIPSNSASVEKYVETLTLPQGISKEFAVGYVLMLTTLSFDNIPELIANKSSILGKNSNLKQVAFGLMNRCEDIFESCEWKSYNYSCCDGFFPVFTERGFCYAFNSRHYEQKSPWSSEKAKPFEMRYIKETDLKWSLKFKLKPTSIAIPIYILNSDELAGLDVQPQHIWDFHVNRISFSVKQTYTTEDTKQLTIKQRHCVFPTEIQLKTDRIYTYTACTRECRMDNAVAKCKCVPHFYPELEGIYRHCTVEELECVARNLKWIQSVERCSCSLGCDNTVYEVEKLNDVMTSDLSDELEATFVSWPMVRYKREVLFGWVDLFVSFGGIAGLFLGFSLLSGVEIVYFFTVRACCMLVKDKDELETIQWEKEARPGFNYDLSLKPKILSKRFYRKNLHNRKISPFKPKKLQAPYGIDFTN